MAFIQRFELALTTDAAGAATGYFPACSGLIESLRYAKTDFTDGVDFTITLERTGETVWSENNVNASTQRSPRKATHGTDGAAATYDGTRAVLEKIAIAEDRVKVVIASGGDTKSGTFHLLVS